MELLDVEACTLPSLVVISNLLPDSLSDFVGGSLSWPAEITGDLEANKLRAHVYISSHEVQRVVKVPDRTSFEVLLLGVNTDV